MADEQTGKTALIVAVPRPSPDSEKDKPADGEFTPVMVRLRAPELEIVDTLINIGIAPNRAEAVT